MGRRFTSRHIGGMSCRKQAAFPTPLSSNQGRMLLDSAQTIQPYLVSCHFPVFKQPGSGRAGPAFHTGDPSMVLCHSPAVKR